ncbi:glyceraldehyde-3-phosphate dehydrogenase [Mycetocola reblochoni]|uniref:NADPH-dependent glyceraldehyde-3-phosphate dehydrogenase n=2 Tax=Mycetocola reblochoni TaxID=331618 RepID=A0A1R4JA13_9MICO|nr:glyceraldehyde-3-phosphate dehydrogenase [Mycetocola reblochoni]RLP70054.1 glyceraldehyde-3-phosphate dehydrogenase [Mycetocola reblochoni]SJN28888.1 NADPH-dependent glyceraldehyde-3-phosphate dehydrogenase [Mycetocola reblochoni REB411]
MNTTSYEDHQRRWIRNVEQAERIIPLIGSLYRDRGVVTSIHGRRLINLSAVDLLRVHAYAAEAEGVELSVTESAALLRAITRVAPPPASLDVARLARLAAAERPGEPLGDDPAALDAVIRAELRGVLRGGDTDVAIDEVLERGRDVVLYGFGRIGRLLARILIAHAGNGRGPRLRAIVARRGSPDDLVKRASLLARDSVHGPFDGTIEVDEQAGTITANGTVIQVIYANDPSEVDYEAFGIVDAIVVDNTGRWRDREQLSRHLASPGASRVLLTAPGSGDVPNIVHGINHDSIADDDVILSAASCTTNAITPVLKALDDAYGVVRGHVETVHSFTNDQNLIDNFHSGDRRGRSAALNMVITETGAAKAVAKALPALAGRLTGSAIRVPTPDVSLAILNLRLGRRADRAELNGYLREVSRHSALRQQVDFVDSPELVSTDIVGSNRAGVVDGQATIADAEDVVVYVWYDNEFGYACQVVRVIEAMAGTHPVVVPRRREVTLASG